MTRVVAALAVLALMLGGCGGDGGDPERASTPPPKSDAAGAEGTGYTLQPPEGYRDLSDRFKGSAVRVDLAYAEKPRGEFATNIVVIREQPGGDFDLGDAVKAFTQQAEAQAGDEGVSVVEDREIDGVEAKTWAFRRRENNGRIRQRQVVAVKDGAIYTITWSVAADAFEAQEATLDEILASWRWT